MRELEFWFEFASTYSYLAAMRIEPLAQRAGVSVQYRPFLLGPIFAAQGWNDSPFNVYPIKGQYMWRDMERGCQALGLPFRKPATFPKNGLLAARVTLVGLEQAWGPAFVRAVYGANFAEDRDIGSSEVLSAILSGLGVAPAPVLVAAATAEIKARLRAQGELAVQRGIFGAPSFVVRGELFWGNDRLEQALAFATE